jgi:hypothetical protein
MAKSTAAIGVFSREHSDQSFSHSDGSQVSAVSLSSFNRARSGTLSSLSAPP